MVWGAIWKGGKSPLVIMIRDERAKRKGYSAWSYQQALLEEEIPIYDGTRRFQQDNARIHTAQSTERFLMEHGIEYIDWPAHSPDLNPIEHIWKLLKSNIRKMFPHLEHLKSGKVDKEELERCIKAAWDAITLDEINNLIDSLPRRIEAVIRAKGWYTKY
jgi:transposase InsO family protein